jgi:integrase
MTKRDHKIALKRILEHLNNPLAAIIKTSTPAKYLPRFFLTVHDILKMVTCDHPHLRDKAMAACLYESNCRPHEFFMLKRSDIRFEISPAKIWDGNGNMIKIVESLVGNECARFE